MTVEEIRGNRRSENGGYDSFPVGMRVLAVDDDPICLKLLEGLLRKCQYHVTITNQARTALKMLRENRDRFDLVISDVHMPDMDGFKLLELVGLEMDLPVIMLSANSDTKLVMKGVTHGACDYLVKPVRIEELRNIWQHVLRRRKNDSKNQKRTADQDKIHPESGEGGKGASQTGNTDQGGKLNKKRKDEEDEGDDSGYDNDDPSTQKKPRVVWSMELHRKFVAAVNQLGIEKAVPKRILDLMNVEGLTRENVASHLQKYRIYLKRISTEASHQANMAAALGIKDSAYFRMGSLDGLRDFRTLSGPQALGNAALSSYIPGSILGRLNSPAGVSLHNLTSSGLIQPNQIPNINNSMDTMGKLHQGISSNTSLFQGIPSSLELDQLQQNKCTPHTGASGDSNILMDLRATNGNLGNPLNNSSVVRGNSHQVLTSGGFGSRSSLNTASLNLESFNVGGSSILLDHSRSNENWQTAVQLANFQVSSPPVTEPAQLPLNGVRSHLQSNPLEFSSSNAVSVPLESRVEMQFQEGLAGDVGQNMNQALTQKWGGHDRNYAYSTCNMTFSTLNTLVPAGQQKDNNFNGKMDMSLIGPSNEGSSALLQQGEILRSSLGSRTKLNENFQLEQANPQCGFVPRSYDSLDDLMNVMIKRDPEGSMLDGGYGPDAFGSCI